MLTYYSSCIPHLWRREVEPSHRHLALCSRASGGGLLSLLSVVLFTNMWLFALMCRFRVIFSLWLFYYLLLFTWLLLLCCHYRRRVVCTYVSDRETFTICCCLHDCYFCVAIIVGVWYVRMWVIGRRLRIYAMIMVCIFITYVIVFWIFLVYFFY